MTASHASVPTKAGIDHVKKPNGPPSIALGSVFAHVNANQYDSQTCNAADANMYKIRTAAPVRMTGRIQSDVTAMCMRVWNQSRFSGTLIAPQTPISCNFCQFSARGPTL